MRLQKGSASAKAYMAKLRKMRKKSAPPKPVAKKAVKKKSAPPKAVLKNIRTIPKSIGASKKSSSSHKDTKSHNVNIRVVSGVSLFGNKLGPKKIDVMNFTANDMLAKLLVFQKNWATKPELVFNKKKATAWAKKAVKENFIYPPQTETRLVNNLLLFLMGVNDNIFSKQILSNQ